MPTEELEQALLEAKWGSAETDVIDAVSKLLELDRAVVVRVAFALDAAHEMRLLPEHNPENELEEELCNAIKAKLRRALTRGRVRQAIIDDSPMYAHPRSLIKKPRDICNGCRFSLECVTKSYSTPDKCFKSGPPATIREFENGTAPSLMRFTRGGCMVSPIRIRGDLVTVKCVHPYGTFDIDIGEIWA
jgi:hypothetical protein